MIPRIGKSALPGSGRPGTAAGPISSRASVSHLDTRCRTQPQGAGRSARTDEEDPFAGVSLSRQTGVYSNFIFAFGSMTASRAACMERKPTVEGRRECMDALGRVRPSMVSRNQGKAPNGCHHVPA